MIPHKVTLTFKTPDVVYNTAEQYAHQQPLDEDEDERDIADAIAKKLGRWVQWGEYVTIEFDLMNDTARVIER